MNIIYKNMLSIYIILYIFLISNKIYASTTTGLPWERPLERILESLTGPVAKVLGVIAIVIAGFGIAFGESGRGVCRIFQVVLGLSIAFTASSIIFTLLDTFK